MQISSVKPRVTSVEKTQQGGKQDNVKMLIRLSNEPGTDKNLKPIPINEFLKEKLVEPQKGEFEQLKHADQKLNTARLTTTTGAKHGIKHNR